MAGIAVSNEVHVRNSLGQFIRACEDGARETAQEAIRRGERLSAGLAPTSGRNDPRTPSLAASFYSRMIGPTSGVWGNTARHALHQEFGTSAHEQTGDVSFFWERHWRMWEPGENVIQHPGNPPHPYLRPAYELIMGQITMIAREKYPN